VVAQWALDVLSKPDELLLTKGTQAPFLDIGHIDQPDEVHPFLFEAVPSSSCRIFAESFPVLCTAIVDVVLARNIEHVLCSALFQHLGECVELCRVRKV